MREMVLLFQYTLCENELGFHYKFIWLFKLYRLITPGALVDSSRTRASEP